MQEAEGLKAAACGQAPSHSCKPTTPALHFLRAGTGNSLREFSNRFLQGVGKGRNSFWHQLSRIFLMMSSMVSR